MRPEPVPITLVIPTYNRRGLLGATLDSALAQTAPFAEIIVVDDGSADGTADWLAQAYPQVRVHRQPNAGVQVARNTGMALARTEWAALLDSDDLLEPGHAEAMAAYAAQHPALDAIYCNFVTFSSRGADPDKLARAPFDFTAGARFDGDLALDIPDLYLRSVRYQPLFTCGLLVHRRFVQAHGGYDPAFRGVGAEDWEFTLRLASAGRVALSRRVLARVRKHESNDSADNLHMSRGEARILAHGLQHHRAAQQGAAEVRQSMRARLQAALGSAFDRQDFVAVRCITQELGPSVTPKLRLKAIIAGLPLPLARALWRALQ